MAEPKPAGLKLCPFSDYLSGALEQRLDVIPWYELSPQAQGDWLAIHADSVRAVITGGHIGCPNALMLALPRLGIVCINGVGFDKVDLDLARARGVAVTTTPDTLTDDVADLAVGLVIALLRRLPAADAYVRAGRWPEGEMPLAGKVTGRRFGIVGLGKIGAAIAARLTAFGPVAYTGPSRKPVPYRYQESLHELARECDVLILASAANASTRGMIDAAVLQALGERGVLVNVARGSLVDEPALIAALESGQIAGAALDVFADEPNVPEALRRRPDAVLTPHIASATVETRMRMADLVLENLDAFLAGNPPLSALP